MRTIFCILIIAFVCGSVPAATGAEVDSGTAAKLRLQLIKAENPDNDDLAETESDYLFALKEEHASSSVQLKAMLELANVNRLLLWFEALSDFHVADLQSLTLLHQVMQHTADSNIHALPQLYAAVVWRLGQEVNALHLSSLEERRLQGETLWRLAALLQDDSQYGRKLGAMAMERLANVPESADGIKRDAIFRVLYAYEGERPPGREDGDLLIRCVQAACSIVSQCQDKYMLGQAEGMFPEMIRRSSAANAVRVERLLVNTAECAKMDDSVLSTLRTQLGCGYILSGDYIGAESILRESSGASPSPSLLASLYLAECLRRRQKYDQCIQLCRQIVKMANPTGEKFAAELEALANAVLGQALIDQGKFAAAEQPLKFAEQFFDKHQARVAMFLWSQPNAMTVLPSEQEIVNNLAVVYQNEGRLSEAERLTSVKKSLERAELESKLAQAKDDVDSYSRRQGIAREHIQNRAAEFIDLCARSDQTPEKRAHLLIEYAEHLIADGKPEIAERCLAACSSGRFMDKEDRAWIAERILLDRLWIAECQGDLRQAKQLLNELPDAVATRTQPSLSDPQNTGNESHSSSIEELATRYDLLSGDYEGAELRSRDLETALDRISQPVDIITSDARDDFVEQNLDALVDRAQACLHLQKFDDASKLLRAVLSLRGRGKEDQLLNASTLLAICYHQMGHDGLAHAAREQAVYLLVRSESEPTRVLADAYLKLATFGSNDQSPIRVKRYLQSAKKIAELSHLEQTALYKEICAAMQ